MLATDQHGENNINLHNTVFDFWCFFFGWCFFSFIVLSMGENSWLWLPPKLPVASPSVLPVSRFQATWNVVFLDFKLLYKLTLPCGCQHLGEKKSWLLRIQEKFNRSLPSNPNWYRVSPIEPCEEYGFVRATRVGGPFSKSRFLGRNQCGPLASQRWGIRWIYPHPGCKWSSPGWHYIFRFENQKLNLHFPLLLGR